MISNYSDSPSANEKSEVIPSPDEEPIDIVFSVDSANLLEQYLRNYSNFMNSRMGDKGRSSTTQNAKCKGIKRVLEKFKIVSFDQLLEKDEIKTITEAFDTYGVENCTRYDYCILIKEFLEYVEVEEAGEVNPNLRRAIRRWDNCRTSYQRGLMEDRKVKKSKDNKAMEEGKFPTLALFLRC